MPLLLSFNSNRKRFIPLYTYRLNEDCQTRSRTACLQLNGNNYFFNITFENIGWLLLNLFLYSKLHVLVNIQLQVR